MMTLPLYPRKSIPIKITYSKNGNDKLLELLLQWRFEELVGIILIDEGQERCFYRDTCSHRLLFYRQLEISGIRERIELRIKEKVTGDIRINITPWYFDDWTLESTFRELV